MGASEDDGQADYRVVFGCFYIFRGGDDGVGSVGDELVEDDLDFVSAGLALAGEEAAVAVGVEDLFAYPDGGAEDQGETS